MESVMSHLSEIVAAVLGLLAGASITYTVTSRSNRATDGGSVKDYSGATAARDQNFGTVVHGDAVTGDKVTGDKFTAHTVTLNK